ncbi:MAG: ABC transporter permease [Bosea sp. (in: a-proteobacteria)]
MTGAMLISILMTVVIAATPILIAALGELVTEKAGVLNLGVEGMMLTGAVAGFIIAALTGNLFLAFLAAALAGVMLSLVFAALAIGLSANQVAAGLALTIFGAGLSSLAGQGYVGRTVGRLEQLFPDALSDHPVLRLIFGYDAMVYLSLALTLGVAWFLKRTRAGLILRAVGENHDSAHAIGYPVKLIRTGAAAFGGACAGLSGAYFSLALTPMWADNLTAGRGWIALALVVFAAWSPGRLALGAYLFGAVMTLELHMKAAGVRIISPEFLAMAPYLASVLVLTWIAWLRQRAGEGRMTQAPACLGKPFN